MILWVELASFVIWCRLVAKECSKWMLYLTWQTKTIRILGAEKVIFTFDKIPPWFKLSVLWLLDTRAHHWLPFRNFWGGWWSRTPIALQRSRAATSRGLARKRCINGRYFKSNTTDSMKGAYDFVSFLSSELARICVDKPANREYQWGKEVLTRFYVSSLVLFIQLFIFYLSNYCYTELLTFSFNLTLSLFRPLFRISLTGKRDT